MTREISTDHDQGVAIANPAFSFEGAMYCWRCVLAAFELGGYSAPRHLNDVEADLDNAARTYRLDTTNSDEMPVRVTAADCVCARCGDSL